MKSLNKAIPIARMRLLCLATVVVASCSVGSALAEDGPPPCFGPENYATQVALSELVNAHRVEGASAFYTDTMTPYGLTTRLIDAKPVGMASGPGMPATTVYRQIQVIEVRTRQAKAFELLTISEVSAAECSLAAPTVILMHPDYAVLRVGASVVVGPGDR